MRFSLFHVKQCPSRNAGRPGPEMAAGGKPDRAEHAAAYLAAPRRRQRPARSALSQRAALARSRQRRGLSRAWCRLVCSLKRPVRGVHLVESNGRKCAFLRLAAARDRRAGDRPSGTHRSGACRLERTGRLRHRPGPGAACPPSRACRALLLSGAPAAFFKGADFAREIDEATQSWDLDLVKHQSRIDERGVILEIRRAARKEAGPRRRLRGHEPSRFTARHRAGQPEGRRRQDDDGDQPRHRPGRDRRGRADRRSRSAGQRLDRARHRPQEPGTLDLRPAARRGAAGRSGDGNGRAAGFRCPVDARSAWRRARNRRRRPIARSGCATRSLRQRNEIRVGPETIPMSSSIARRP